MAFHFFKRLIPSQIRFHFLTSMSCSAWLYLLNECNFSLVVQAALLTACAIDSGIETYQNSHRFEGEYDPEPESEVLGIAALKSG